MKEEEKEVATIYKWFWMTWPKYHKSWSLSMNGIYIPGPQKLKYKIINAIKSQGGMLEGENDFKILLPTPWFVGLCVEHKTLTGKPGKGQPEYLEYMRSLGFAAMFTYGVDDAMAVVKTYMNLRLNNKKK